MSTKKGTRFVKPKPAEVEAYARIIQFPINGEEFCDFYQSKGWKVGSSPMKDWQAAVRTWRRGFVSKGGVLLESKDEIKSVEPTSQQARNFFDDVDSVFAKHARSDEFKHNIAEHFSPGD